MRDWVYTGQKGRMATEYCRVMVRYNKTFISFGKGLIFSHVFYIIGIIDTGKRVAENDFRRDKRIWHVSEYIQTAFAKA